MVCAPYSRLFCLLLLLAGAAARAQQPTCPAQGYNYRLAFTQVHGYLLTADQWQYFSDTPDHREVFTSKAQFRRKSQVEIIPARRFVVPAGLTASGDSIDWTTWFQPDYNQFLAFLAYERRVVALLVSSPEPYRRHAPPGNMGVDGSGDPSVLFRTFYEPGVCLFYDTQLRTYAYVKDGAYVYWNYSRHQFSTVQGLAGYRGLRRTGGQ